MILCWRVGVSNHAEIDVSVVECCGVLLLVVVLVRRTWVYLRGTSTSVCFVGSDVGYIWCQIDLVDYVQRCSTVA